MKRRSLLASLTILGFYLMGTGFPLFPQEVPAEKKAKAKGIEGFWTQIHSETDGDSSPSLMNPGETLREKGVTNHYIWKFSKDEVGSGYDNGNFPVFRNRYELNPDGKMGAIDLTPLDEKGNKMEKAKMKGIYFLKDDILMICFAYDTATARPMAFNTSFFSKSRLVILRPGKLN